MQKIVTNIVINTSFEIKGETINISIEVWEGYPLREDVYLELGKQIFTNITSVVKNKHLD